MYLWKQECLHIKEVINSNTYQMYSLIGPQVCFAFEKCVEDREVIMVFTARQHYSLSTSCLCQLNEYVHVCVWMCLCIESGGGGGAAKGQPCPCGDSRVWQRQNRREDNLGGLSQSAQSPLKGRQDLHRRRPHRTQSAGNRSNMLS